MPSRQLLAGYATQREAATTSCSRRRGAPRPHWDALPARARRARRAARSSDTLALTERADPRARRHLQRLRRPEGRRPAVGARPAAAPPSRRRMGSRSRPASRSAPSCSTACSADLYGPQELLQQRRDPAAGGLRPQRLPARRRRACGRRAACTCSHYAADLARSPDGRWWVVSDRTQAPSGAGYALENRLVVSRVFPQLFRDLHVQHLARFFDALRDSLLHWAPQGRRPAADRAAHAGAVQRDLLRARAAGALPRLPAGRGQRPDGARRPRLAEDHRRPEARARASCAARTTTTATRSSCAPTRRSACAGLTECARRGNVLIANALGSGVLESGALLGYLPRLARAPARRAAAAAVDRDLVAAASRRRSTMPGQRLDQLIIKPLERSPREPAVFGADLSTPSARAAAGARRRAAAALRRAGVGARLAGAGARARGAAPSAFARAHRRPARVRGGHARAATRVMPGGLTRVAGDEDSRVIAMQRGGRSKDTWVLSDGAGRTRRSRCCRTHGDRRTTWSLARATCRRASPRTCSGSAATANAATTRRGCCAWRSASVLDDDGRARRRRARRRSRWRARSA